MYNKQWNISRINSINKSKYKINYYFNRRKNWRILELSRYEIRTTNAPQYQVPVWRDHTIGPSTAKNGDNYCTAPKKNMGKNACDNLA